VIGRIKTLAVKGLGNVGLARAENVEGTEVTRLEAG